MTDIQERARFDFIRYANCWEDTDILLEALQVKKGARCISIASAGDNTLSLLTADPKIVIGVDLSRVQLANVELRIAALKHLDDENVLKLLGFKDSNRRLALFKTIKRDISDESLKFLENNLSILDSGIIYSGKFEKYFGTFRTRVLPLIHGKKTVAALLEEKSPEAQKDFYQRTWNNLRWRILFRVFFSRYVMGKLGRDPEFFKYVEGGISSRIFKRAEYALANIPTYNNLYLHFIATGKFPLHALPHYLRPGNIDLIRNNLDRVELYEGTLSQALHHYKDYEFDAFNLSDIFEYISEVEYMAQLSEIVANAAPGARLAFWNTLVKRTIPDNCPFKSEEAFAEELLLRDKAFFYNRFVVGEKS